MKTIMKGGSSRLGHLSIYHLCTKSKNLDKNKELLQVSMAYIPIYYRYINQNGSTFMLTVSISKICRQPLQTCQCHEWSQINTCTYLYVIYTTGTDHIWRMRLFFVSFLPNDWEPCHYLFYTQPICLRHWACRDIVFDVFIKYITYEWCPWGDKPLLSNGDITLQSGGARVCVGKLYRVH